jgi:hypothetical protein
LVGLGSSDSSPAEISQKEISPFDSIQSLREKGADQRSVQTKHGNMVSSKIASNSSSLAH